MTLAGASSARVLDMRWHRADYAVARTSNGSAARFDATVKVDGIPFLAGDIEVPPLPTAASIEALVGLVESTAKKTAPSVFVDAVRFTTSPGS